MNNISTLPDWLQKIESYVRQFCELQQIENQIATTLRVPSTDETATHMAVRLAAELEIRSRKDYLAEFITLSVIELFRVNDMLSKYPELHTNRNET